jgi:hypothetical protein
MEETGSGTIARIVESVKLRIARFGVGYLAAT